MKWSTARIALNLACMLFILATLAGVVGCSVQQARQELERQERIAVQFNTWHQAVDSIIRQLATGAVGERAALDTLAADEHVATNAQLLQQLQQVRQRVAGGEPLLLALLDVSQFLGMASERHALALAELREQLQDAQDGQDATLAVISSVVTGLTGIPVGALFGLARGRRTGFAQGTFYGAGQVASAIGTNARQNEQLRNGLADDQQNGTLRAGIAQDPIVAAAVERYKDGRAKPAPAVPVSVTPKLVAKAAAAA
jgi:hypothetical protein